MATNPPVKFSHNHHLLAVKGCESGLDVLAFEGSEALSTPFSYRVEFTSADHAISKGMVLMKAASLTLQAPVDLGYGMAQMINPAPDYTTTWSWKENVKAGSDLFQTKHEQAIRHLSQHGTYTGDMVEREAISLWNGGYYYKWDGTLTPWVRKYNHLCDSNTGNIGWNMNNPTNTGQTEAQLHNRDQPTYSSGSDGQSAEHAWVYSGLCYADKIYGE